LNKKKIKDLIEKLFYILRLDGGTCNKTVFINLNIASEEYTYSNANCAKSYDDKNFDCCRQSLQGLIHPTIHPSMNKLGNFRQDCFYKNNFL
jgi:hypothetical protein